MARSEFVNAALPASKPCYPGFADSVHARARDGYGNFQPVGGQVVGKPLRPFDQRDRVIKGIIQTKLLDISRVFDPVEIHIARVQEGGETVAQR